MKKLIVGLLVLIVIFSASLANTVYLDLEISRIKTTIEESISLPDEDGKAAIQKAYEYWKALRTYRNMILRENKCDDITKNFIVCIEEPEKMGIKKELLYQLESVIESEKISAESIF